MDELQNSFDDFYEELKKMGSNLEIDELKSHAKKIKIENNSLNAKFLDLTSCLEKITQGQKNLNLLLWSQKYVYDKVGFGYNILKKQKLYKNIYVKFSPISRHNLHVPIVIIMDIHHILAM